MRLPTKFRSVAAALSAGLIGSAVFADGEIITVTTRFDVTDFGPLQQAAELPGPDGKVSFREACLAANNTPGSQTIHFAIPQSEWSGAIVYLLNDGGSFSLSDDGNLVDFTTQTAFTGDTNPNGWEVGVQGTEPNAMGSPALYVSGDGNTIKGMGQVIWRGYGVHLAGNNNRVISSIISGPLYAGVYINGGFYGPPATGNIVGGTEPGEGNILSAGNSGVRIDGPARNNIVIGNTLTGAFWGAEVRTATCCPDQDLEAIDNRIGGPTLAERNIINGAGKFGEEGFPTGGQVAVQYSTGTIVEGNYIGVQADSMTVPTAQRGPVGVELRSSPASIVRDNVIGGILVVGVNHFAGQRFGNGISLRGDCDGSVIEGNLIGVAADRATPVPNRAGIVASYWSINGMPVTAGPVTIGGNQSGDGNTVAHSETNGVTVHSQISGVRITGNSIHDNGGLGIELLTSTGGSGVSSNDECDADAGANGVQNFPVITSAQSGPSSTTVAGTFNSTPNTAFTLEFSASPTADASGYGEGQTFLGSIGVITDEGCNADFAATLPTGSEPGSFISGTAIEASTGDTSEFALSVQSSGAARAADLNGDGWVNVNDLLMLLGSWGECSSSCAADINLDGWVNVTDLLALIGDWG